MCTFGNDSEVFSQLAGALDGKPQGNDAIPTAGRLAAGVAPTGTMKPTKLLPRCRKSRYGPRAGPAGTSVRVKRTRLANAAPVLVSTDVARTSEDHRTVLGFQVVGHCEAEDPFASLCRAGAEIIVLQARHGHLGSNNARLVAGCDPDLAPEDVKGVDLLRAEFAVEGRPVLSMPSLTPYGSYEFVMEDVDGQRIGIGRVEDEEVLFPRRAPRGSGMARRRKLISRRGRGPHHASLRDAVTSATGLQWRLVDPDARLSTFAFEMGPKEGPGARNGPRGRTPWLLPRASPSEKPSRREGQARSFLPFPGTRGPRLAGIGMANTPADRWFAPYFQVGVPGES